MPDDLDSLIDRLRALPLDLDAADIADALWLSATTRLGRSPSRVEKPARQPPPEQVREPAVDHLPAPPAEPPEPDGVYDGTSTASGGRPARRLRMHRPGAVPMPLDLARSLRAFNRKWQTGRRRQLDLDASVAGYARTGQLTPTFRPAPERWFEATVLVDDSPSMALWRATAAGFTALLCQLGAFRSVRTLTLALGGESPLLRNAAGQATHPRQLRSSTGRRLVLVLSDCLAEAWSRPAVWRLLSDWARSTPTALVNPLPSSIWRRTGLDLPAVRVASGVVGGANTTLRYKVPWELLDQPDRGWVPLPAPALTVQSMRRWANTLMRADPAGADAVLVPSAGRVDDVHEPADALSLETFRHVASEEAFRLAVLGSPHNPVSLPMLDLLRDQLVPAATVSDMAEIVASGVATAERAGGSTVLRFRPNLRDELRKLLSAPEAWRIHEILTDYVATHAGIPGDLVLAVADPTGTPMLPADLQPFADASRTTLEILGVLPGTHTDTGLGRLLSRAPQKDLSAVGRLLVPNFREGTAAGLVRALEGLDSRVEGLPAPVAFAEHLARRVEPPLARELRRWADRQAEELGMASTLRRVRADLADPPQRPAPAAVVTRSNGGALWPLVKALAQLPCMQALRDRTFVVQLLEDRLGTILQVDEDRSAVRHIFNIVVVCDRRPDGLLGLLDVVRELDEGTVHLRLVERMIAERAVPPLWPEEERERLFALLSGMIFKDLVELYREVAGGGAPELPAETSYREVFLTLETLNVDPSGLPMPILFVERLASGRRSELAIELRRWADRQASRLGVITELQKMRREQKARPPGPPPNSSAYLVLLLRRIGFVGEQYQLANWSQLDLSEGWHPERGEDFAGSLDEVKRHVAVLIESVEMRWARYQPAIRIEFVLSGDLLNLDVDQWPWEVDSTWSPVPIGCRYTVAVRSLERMQAGHWHRPWHYRWGVLVSQLVAGAVESESTRRLQAGENIRKLVADFEDNPNVVSLILSKPPDPAQDGGEEVAVGLRAGLPIIIWSRADCDSEEFLTAVRELLHGDGQGDILQRVRQLRTAAYQSHAGHVGNHLALLWDDPERLVVPADLGPPRDPREAV